MRAFVIVVLLAIIGFGPWFAPPRAQAQDAEALRREIAELRRQQEGYRRAIEALSERLQRLEQRPAPTVAAPRAPATPAPGPTALQAPAGVQPEAPPAPPAAMDLLRPRQPFALYQPRGSGQLLFDMGVAGDFVGNVTRRGVDKANAGTFAGRENRFFPREVELSLFGQIDPYARAEVRIEAGEDRPGTETSVSLAEASITLLTLPYGTQAKLGQMRNRFGWSNIIHEHDLPWVDRPDVYRVFLGEDGLREKGLEVTWLPLLPFYLELLGGVFNGDNATAFGFGKLDNPLVTGRARTYFDLTDEHAIQVGFSFASGETDQHHRSTLLGYDVKYKYRPEGWLHPLLTVASEGLYSRRNDAFGYYVWSELQPWRRWALGTRWDWTQFPESPGHQWAIEPYLTFAPSEFFRLRAGYKHTVRSTRIGFSDNDANGRIADELFLQATFSLGAHPAHPF
ncbi:MAG: hypothetical protein HYR86_04820 [Candidatus Rokubacteria bacterium]|nr:hypothetical protein [Candidatus Rokubacteria bacterium]